MENLPENWTLVETFEGNLTFEDHLNEFSVTVEQTGDSVHPYTIAYKQLQGICLKSEIEDTRSSNLALNESQAFYRAAEVMLIIDNARSKKLQLNRVQG